MTEQNGNGTPHGKTIPEYAREAFDWAKVRGKEAYQESTVRQVIFRRNGETLMTVSLTVAVIVGILAALINLWLSLVFVGIGYFAGVRVEITPANDEKPKRDSETDNETFEA